MQVNEENQEQIEGGALPSLNDIISPNSENNPNQVIYQSSTTNEPAGQIKISNITTTKTYEEGGIEEENEIPQEINEIKEENLKDDEENKRYEQTVKIEEEPDSTTKIVKRVIQSEQPVSETSYYEKRVVKTTTTTTTTRGGNTSNSQNINSRYINTNTNTNNVVRNNGNRTGSSTTNTYTRAIPASRGGAEKNIYIRNNNISGRTPSNNRVESNNRYGVQNSPYSNNSSQNRQTQKKVISSQNYIGNKYQPKKTETSYNRQNRSPDQNDVKRKTINRGDPIKNVQITHIICSTKPQEFHITENLNTESLQSEPLEISKADRIKLKQSGKSSWTTSVQDNIKPIVANLKGKTTVFQHARGIGMTNEKKENINPMFYSSEIKKLDPIIKEKEKEKVEYLTFRNEGAGNSTIINKAYNNSNTSRANNNNNNYSRGNNSIQQKKDYSSNTNRNYNSNTANVNNRRNNANTVRSNQVYTRGNYSSSGNGGEIVKETRTKVQMGSRSQYRNSGNPTSSVTTEKRVYNSNTFFNK